MAKQPPRAEPVDTRRYRYSLRLRFEFDGESLQLVDQQRIRKIAPASPIPLPTVGEQQGFWVELRTSRGRTLFHRPVYNPLRTRVEVHSPDRQPRVLTGPPQAGTFSVLVPDIPEASRVVVFGAPLDEAKARAVEGRSEELASFELKDRAKGETP